MLFVYSGTGNSRDIADRISERMGIPVVDIPDAMRRRRFEYDAGGKPVGFAVPVYFRGLPFIVEEFAGKVSVSRPGRSFAVLTCAFDSGRAGEDLAGLLGTRLKIDCLFDARMPDSLAFSREAAAGPEAGSAAQEADRIVDAILSGSSGDLRSMASDADNGPDRAAYRRLASPEGFHAGSGCTSCRMCSELCPEKAISFYSPKPEWDEKGCSLCMRCVNICPCKAISFGGNDSGRRHIGISCGKACRDYMLWRIHQKIPPIRRNPLAEGRPLVERLRVQEGSAALFSRGFMASPDNSRAGRDKQPEDGGRGRRILCAADGARWHFRAMPHPSSARKQGGDVSGSLQEALSRLQTSA